MIIKTSAVIFGLLCLHESYSFTVHPRVSTTPTCHGVKSSMNFPHMQTSQDDVERDDQKKKRNIQEVGQLILKRTDTLRTAGFYDISDEEKDEFKEPLIAGAKTNITLFLLALGYKWYRSIFINKMAIWERQPQWNTVITSKEDEEKANLEALTCKNCGATIFIAKGRKWFQMPRGYECYVCGASGNDNFENTREDLLEEIEDDYFDYEKPLDFVTAAERRKLMKEAGGDEDKAIALLTQQTMEGSETEVEVSTTSSDEEGAAPKKKKKKKKKGKKKKKKSVPDENDDGAKGNGSDEISSPTAEQSKEPGASKKEITGKGNKTSDDEIDLLDMD